MLYKKLLSICLVLILSHQLLNAQCSGVCSPLLYEEFNYTANTAIRAAVGGTGWSAGWDVQNDSVTVPGYSVSSGSLSSGTIKAFNNRLSGGLAFLTIGRLLNTSNATNAPFASFIDSASLIGKKGTTLYYSILLRKNGNNTQQVRAMLHKGNTSWSVSNTGTVGIGYFGTASETSGTKFWSIQVEGTTTKTTVPVSIGTTALLVLKIELLTNNTTKYSLFVNPTTIGSAGEPATPTLTQTVSKLMDFKAMALRLGDASGQADIDEIRMAPTYQCATPDASTAYNLLPVASFTKNISSGTAPFTVSFDGTSSSDPDGTIASYSWSCSDGTTATGATPNIVFKNQGAITVTLTVTDNCGSVSSTSSTVLVNNSKGYFSCFATPKLSKFGNCDSTTGGGEIIFTGGTSYSLFNKKTSATTNQNSGTFSNLNAGYYRIAVAGDLGCKDTFNLQVPISHECAGQARGSLMKMGVNIEPLDYFNQCATFKDYMVSSGNFFTFNASGTTAFDTKLMSLIPVDSNGYPLQVPYTPASNVAQKVRKFISSTTKHLPLGNYVLLYDGTGTFNINGASITSSAANRIVYNVTGTGNVWLEILSSSSTDHVRNIRFVKLADESTFTTQPFSDKFLRTLCSFSCIRFMQIQSTIGNANTVWSGRTISTFHSQADLATVNKGIAYEHICNLANTTGKDIWICVPHLVDDNYITEMAKLFKAKLNPGIKVFLEFSNEVWNFGYVETMDVYNAGPQNIANARRYALRCGNMFNLWKQVWGNDFNRITRVLGTQAVNNTNGQEAMAELQDNFDVIAPALYFNYTKDASCYANLKSLGTAATTHDILNCAKNDFLTSWASVAQNNKDAWMYGKGVVHYEFGQGLNSGSSIESFQDSTYAAQLTTEMAALYQQTIDSLKHWNTDQINPYELTGERQSKYGSWGHLEYIDQDTATEPAPKFSVLLKNINPAVQGTCLYPGVPITAASDSNGTISPSGNIVVAVNSNQAFTITPKTGFCIKSVFVDGTDVGAVASFTFTNITNTHSISVTYITAVTPTIFIAAATNNVCSGTSITFTATPVNAGNSPIYQWKINGNNVGTNTTTFTTSSLQNNDVVSCVMTANNTCQTTATATSNNVTAIIKLPTTSTTSLSVCASSLPLVWNTLTFNNAATQTAHLTNSKGCDSAATLVLSILSASSSTTSASVCSNQLPFIWNGNSFNNSGTFVVHLTNSKGCDSAASFVFTVLSPTSSTATINVCSNQLPYIWRGLVFDAAGTQTAHLTNSVGCDSAVALTVTVGGAVTPSVSIATTSSTVCSGNNVTFTANGVNAGISPIYNWKKNGNNLGSGSNITFPAGTLSTGDIIACILTANNSCQTTAIANSNPIQMTVFISPLIGVSTIAIPTLCEIGSTTNVYNSNTNGGGVWTSSNTNIATVSTSNSASGNVTAIGAGITNLIYTKTATNGCSVSASIPIYVATVAVPRLISGNNNICIGSTTTLTTDSTGGKWSTPSSSIASVNANTGVVTGNSAGIATIIYRVENGVCSASRSYNVTVNLTPTVPSMTYVAGTPNPQTGAGGAFCVGKTFKVVGYSPIAPSVPNLTGVWSSSDTSLVSIKTVGSGNNKDTGLVVIKAAGTGVNLTYKVTSPVGCINSRVTTFNTSVNCPYQKGVIKEESIVSSVQFTMYPNPAHSTVSLQVDRLVGSGSIVVTDLYGKQVKTQALSMGTNTIDISNLAKGFYFVSTITEQGKTTKKLVVE